MVTWNAEASNLNHDDREEHEDHEDHQWFFVDFVDFVDFVIELRGVDFHLFHAN